MRKEPGKEKVILKKKYLIRRLTIIKFSLDCQYKWIDRAIQ